VLLAFEVAQALAIVPITPAGLVLAADPGRRARVARLAVPRRPGARLISPGRAP
jgi:hypothetical protein